MTDTHIIKEKKKKTFTSFLQIIITYLCLASVGYLVGIYSGWVGEGDAS